MDIRLEKKMRLQKAKAMKFLIILLFGSIIFRCVQLQILEGRRFQTLADGNRVRIIRMKPLRGTIYDRTGTILADNSSSFTITATYADMRQREKEINLLSELLGLTQKELHAKISKAKFSLFEPYPLIRNAPIEVVSIIEEHGYDLPGIKTVVEPIRHYPLSELTSHFLGFISEVSPIEYDKLKNKDYKSGDQIGKSGLEKQYEETLRGNHGYVYMEVDVWGRELNQLTEKAPIQPQAGNDLYLTIDIALQDTLSRHLSKWGLGAGVALDPQSGAILAFCSLPSFDANLFTYGITRENWQLLNNNPKRPLFNRVIQGTYPPGSTFKLLTALIGLEQEYISPESKFSVSCQGGCQIGNRFFRCWKSSGHGSLVLKDAITRSCDVYFYQTGLRTSLQIFSDYAHQAGFSRLTGVDLPNEASGFVPTEKWAKDKFEGNAYPRGIMANWAIGQGEILVTPIQLARFFGAIANGGVLYIPNLVEKIVSPSGELVNEHIAEYSTLAVSKDQLDLLSQACYNVVNGPGGTGGRARIEGSEVCGKTGTAQNPHGEDHAWFVGYAPRHKPKIVVAVVVEHGGHGSSAAAPIVRKVIKTYLDKNQLTALTNFSERN